MGAPDGTCRSGCLISGTGVARCELTEGCSFSCSASSCTLTTACPENVIFTPATICATARQLPPKRTPINRYVLLVFSLRRQFLGAACKERHIKLHMKNFPPTSVGLQVSLGGILVVRIGTAYPK